ncbi:hypothetical protein M8C21_028966, partial [Ambrosia artemisiifolia]
YETETFGVIEPLHRFRDQTTYVRSLCFQLLILGSNRFCKYSIAVMAMQAGMGFSKTILLIGADMISAFFGDANVMTWKLGYDCWCRSDGNCDEVPIEEFQGLLSTTLVLMFSHHNNSFTIRKLANTTGSVIVRKGVLPRLLDEILSTRIMVKQAMKKLSPSDKVLHRIYNAQQLALKLIAKVTYGYTAAAAGFSGRMPCAELADSIIQCGRRTLENAILHITYSAHTDLSVKFQSHRSMDYTNPMLPVASSAIDPNGQFSLGLDGKKIESESNVLLASIENMRYAVALEVLQTVFSAFGPVLKIAMFDKNGGVQALIQYPDVQTAVVAKEALEGHCIYDGGFCKLHNTYSRHTDLSLLKVYGCEVAELPLVVTSSQHLGKVGALLICRSQLECIGQMKSLIHPDTIGSYVEVLEKISTL